MKINELLIEFDEMGFAPTTLCGNPDEYAREWKKKLVAEIKRLNIANERFEINMKSVLEIEKKQAKVDVLNELRNYCVTCEYYYGEIQHSNEQLLKANEGGKIRPAFGESEKKAINSIADKANGQATMANKVFEYIDRLLKQYGGEVEE